MPHLSKGTKGDLYLHRLYYRDRVSTWSSNSLDLTPLEIFIVIQNGNASLRILAGRVKCIGYEGRSMAEVVPDMGKCPRRCLHESDHLSNESHSLPEDIQGLVHQEALRLDTTCIEDLSWGGQCRLVWVTVVPCREECLTLSLSDKVLGSCHCMEVDWQTFHLRAAGYQSRTHMVYIFVF